MPYLSPDGAWPRRLFSGIVDVQEPIVRWRGWQAPDGSRRPVAGVLREQIAPLIPEDAEETRLYTEGPGSFIIALFPPLSDSTGDGADYFFHVCATETDPGPDGAPAADIDRTHFAFYQPTGEPRGVALVLPGMLGTPQPVIDAFVDTLRESGWAVIRDLGLPARFTERFRFTVDLADDQAAADSARRIAVVLDGLAADAAEAARAAFEHVYSLHPDLASLPRIGVGMSGGGMVLSTVAALEPDAYDALVYIGAGAHLLRVGELSSYVDLINAFRVTYAPTEPTPDEHYAFHRLYLDYAPLDPYHTAGRLLGTPVLMIHADRDRAVPAHLGDVLWRRLGRPERWTSPVGHEMLFALLPARFDDIIRWLDRNALSEPAPGAD